MRWLQETATETVSAELVGCKVDLYRESVGVQMAPGHHHLSSSVNFWISLALHYVTVFR